MIEVKNGLWLVSAIALLVMAGTITAFAMGERPPVMSVNFKVTVAVETPEGVKTGSAVRHIGNGVPLIDLPDVGNPAGVQGEAVVVDLGQRGVLFALISSDSDMEFYNAFPASGPSTPAGIRYYASLPVGTKGVLNPERFPGYPKLVTFTDMNDPKSVTLAQVWERDDKGYYHLKDDRLADLFGKGVTLKDIVFEITDEPVTWGKVDEYLPWLENLKTALDGSKFVTSGNLANNLGAGSFKRGEPK